MVTGEQPERSPRPGDPPPGLKLFLLGRFEVLRAGAPIPAQAWRRRRPADLLKLVALAPGRAVDRDAAIDTLWPGKDPVGGANNLHRALYDLRQVLGGRFVDLDHGALRLRPEVWVDVDAFERGIEATSAEERAAAVALYAGDLSPEDRDLAWLASRRAALRARFAEAALPVALEAAGGGEAARAVGLLRRVLEVDPAAEVAHAALVRLLAETGRRAEALRQLEACEAALAAAGRGAPAAETLALRTAIHQGGLGAGASEPALDPARRAARRLLGTAEPGAVRGRGAILLVLESLLETGHGVLVLLGERGVGKSRLAAEGARLAQARGFTVTCGVAGAGGGSAPYGLFADLLAEEARVHPAFVDPLAAAPAEGFGGEQVRAATFDAIERALRAAADGRPLFVLLDDLHAADESSLDVFHRLARRARDLGLCLVATCEEEAIRAGTPIQAVLAHLDATRLARGVRVPRLGLAGTRELVADLAGAPQPEAAVAALHRATDGSPLLVETLVRAQREAGQPVGPGDPAAAIRARVSRLGPDAEALLVAAAVAGPRFDLAAVRAAAGLAPAEAAAALQACADAYLLAEDGPGHRFQHAAVRDAIYEGLPAARRAALHGALADALLAAAGREPPHETLAVHLRGAGQPERAARHLVAAGHRAAARAGLREALRCYEEALQLLPPPGPEGDGHLEVQDALGRVQLALGELAGAARSFTLCAHTLEAPAPGAEAGAPDARARAHRLAATALAAGGELRAAQAAVEDGLAAGGAPGEAAALLHLRAQLLWHDGRHADAWAAAEGCLERAAAAQDHDLAARAADLAALARASLGEPLAPPADAPGRAERERQDPAPEHPVDLNLVLWSRDLLGDAPCDAVVRAAALLRARALARGAPDAVAAARTGEGIAALAAGELDLANLALRDALERHRAAGSGLGEALALERLGTLLTQRGRAAEGLELLEDGVLAAERGGLRLHALTLLHAALARNRLAAAAPYAAEDALREASRAAARHGPCAACDASLRPEAVRVALARGRLGDAETEAAQLEELARKRGGRALVALARLARARVLAAQGRREDALSTAASARVALVSLGHRAEAARAARLELALLGEEAVAPDLRALDALLAPGVD